MRIQRLLAASLGLNLLLVGAGVYLVREDLGDLSTLPPLVVCFPSAESHLAGELGAEDASLGTGPRVSYTAGTIESADFRKYVAHLRGLGCPDDTIRDVIMADVSEMFRGRVNGKAYTANQIAP